AGIGAGLIGGWLLGPNKTGLGLRLERSSLQAAVEAKSEKEGNQERGQPKDLRRPKTADRL
ncbi:MAG: hypothetical protein ACRD9W_13915, partial [Terriglobia bacterium]